MDPTTTRLLECAQGGDRTALEALFERYLPRVRSIVALRMGWRLRELHDLDDLVQGSVLRVFSSLGSFRELSGGAFRNYVARCVENELIDALRSSAAAKRGGGGGRKRRIAREDVQLASLIDARARAPGSEARVREEAEQVEEALRALPARHREVLVLRHFVGLEYAEIATELGFAREVNARMAVSRAMKRLRRLLEEGGGGSESAG